MYVPGHCPRFGHWPNFVSLSPSEDLCIQRLPLGPQLHHRQHISRSCARGAQGDQCESIRRPARDHPLKVGSRYRIASHFCVYCTARPLAISCTSMLPRVALEYGHTLCVAATSCTARSASLIWGRVTSSVTASVKPRSSFGRRLTLLLIETSLTSAHDAQRALEAGGVADCEELLGVCAAALASHLNRRPKLDVQGTVARATVTFCASARDRRLRRVDCFQQLLLRSSPCEPCFGMLPSVQIRRTSCKQTLRQSVSRAAGFRRQDGS
jgi:hypothetical protein